MGKTDSVSDQVDSNYQQLQRRFAEVEQQCVRLVRQDALRQVQNRSLEQLAKGRKHDDVLTTLALAS